jgi:tetratricopeptide (TPR) repeat protein
LSLYAEAKQEYTESIAAYERVWKLMPDYFSVHDQQGVVLFWTIPLPWSDYHSIYNNKGLVWHQIGNLHAMLEQFDEARENYQKAIESIDQALQIIPVYITHDIEKPAVRNPDNLPNGLSQFNEARESHKKTIESVAIDDFNKGIQLLSNKSVIAHNNKGSVLDSLGDLQCDLSLFDEAQESYQAAIESFDESLEYADRMVKYNPFFMLEAMKSYDEALNKYVPRAFIAHNIRVSRQSAKAFEPVR